MSQLRAISDEEMTGHLATSRDFGVVVLRQGPRYQDENARSIIFEHGRRNLQLRAAGLLRVVCPMIPPAAVLCCLEALRFLRAAVTFAPPARSTTL